MICRSQIIIGKITKVYRDSKSYLRYANLGMPIHRAVAQNKIGRGLRDNEVVYHQDGNKSNFRRSNLSVISRSFHSKLHSKMGSCF